MPYVIVISPRSPTSSPMVFRSLTSSPPPATPNDDSEDEFERR
jgi:hypothetical protein